MLFILVIEVLRDYMTDPRTTGKERGTVLLDDNLKTIAFNLTNNFPAKPLFGMAATAFQLHTSPQLFADHVNGLIQTNRYTTALAIATVLGLVDESYVNRLLLPLAFNRDHWATLQKYLDQTPAMRIPLLRTLDSLLSQRASTRRLCEEMAHKYNFRNLNTNNYDTDYLRKTMPKIRKLYKIDTRETPNLNQLQIGSSLGFLIKKWLDKEMCKYIDT